MFDKIKEYVHMPSAVDPDAPWNKRRKDLHSPEEVAKYFITTALDSFAIALPPITALAYANRVIQTVDEYLQHRQYVDSLEGTWKSKEQFKEYKEVSSAYFQAEALHHLVQASVLATAVELALVATTPVAVIGAIAAYLVISNIIRQYHESHSRNSIDDLQATVKPDSPNKNLLGAFG